MRKIQKEKTIWVDMYVSEDGKEFESESACIHHEKMVNGTRKKCDCCDGKGYTHREWIPEHDHWEGTMGGYYKRTTCPKCKGKGYLERKVTWE